MYQFLLNMWVLKRCTADYIEQMCTKNRITAEQRDAILATPQR